MKNILPLLFLLVLPGHASAGRGDLVSSRIRHHLSREEVRAIASPYGDVSPYHAVEVYEVVYRTLDGMGRGVVASGAIAVPVGVSSAPMVSVQHGTVLDRSDVPSKLPAYWLGDGLLFAGSGYIAVMPDYVGYGASDRRPHPYLHARSLAVSIVDLLRAARHVARARGIVPTGELFLTGYSEGGYATLAAHREIEEHHGKEFAVTASAPMAGPYDLIVTMDVLMRRGSPGSVPFIAFAFWAYDRIYGFGRLRGIIREPYRERIMRMFRPTGTFEPSALPTRGVELFEPRFLEQWAGNGAERIKEAARENVLTAWRPAAPVSFYHCVNDSVVPVENALAARAGLMNHGGTDVRLVERTQGDHGDCFPPLLAQAKSFFDSLRNESQ